MEKIIKILGGEKINPLSEIEPDLGNFLRNVAYIVFALVGVAFTIGSNFSVARQLPDRITATEARIDGLERKQEVTAMQLTNIVEAVTSIKTDVREIRTVQMRTRGDN